MPFGVSGRIATHEVADGTVTEVQFFRGSQVQQAGLADDPCQVDGVVLRSTHELAVGVGRSDGREALPSGGPHSQVTASRVAQGHYLAEVELVLSGDFSEMINAGQDVFECMGPTTAVAGTSVFKVPCGNSMRREVPGQGLAELGAVL